jgi:hypothetical protein
MPLSARASATTSSPAPAAGCARRPGAAGSQGTEDPSQQDEVDNQHDDHEDRQHEHLARRRDTVDGHRRPRDQRERDHEHDRVRGEHPPQQ